jgi:hypothetical protein
VPIVLLFCIDDTQFELVTYDYCMSCSIPFIPVNFLLFFRPADIPGGSFSHIQRATHPLLSDVWAKGHFGH